MEAVSDLMLPSSQQQAQLDGAPPRWYTPKRLLCLFCLVNFLVFLDRGAISSNGVNGTPGDATHAPSGIQGDFGLSLLQAGMLPAACLVGLMLSSLVFAYLAKFINPFKLIGLGMGVWALACTATACAVGFWSLLSARVMAGVGEASICSLSDPFIASIAPESQRTLWLAALYLSGNLGYPLGYIWGGALAGAPLSWRTPFIVQAAASAPLVLFFLLAPPVQLGGLGSHGQQQRKGSDGAGAGAGGGGGAAQSHAGSMREFARELGHVLARPLYSLNLAGSCFCNVALGAYSFWGPQVAHALFDVEAGVVDTTLGGIVALTAVVATLLGGMYLDAAGLSMRSAMAVNAASLGCSYAVLAVAILAARSFAGYCVALTVGMLALFFPSAPAAAINMWAVPPAQRPLASAVNTIAIHLLGDVPSPPLVGAIQGALGDWRVTFSILNLALLASALFYIAGTIASHYFSDYLQSDVEVLYEGQPGSDSGEAMGLLSEEQEQDSSAAPLA